jgi:hypothetical protein
MHYSGSGGAHLLCPRQTFEDAVESCIDMLKSAGDLNTDEYCEVRLKRLEDSRELHTEHWSWVNWPRARAAVAEIVDVAQQRLKKKKRR